MYFAGDCAKWDADGNIWLLGRVDDVMNVAGHQISAIKIETALASHPGVAEAAVVGSPDPTTGRAKTRSGKIMRRLLRDVASDRELGDVIILTDSSIMDPIREKLPSVARED